MKKIFRKNLFEAVKKPIALIIVLSMLMIMTSCSEIEAVTMRVLRYEGSVSLISGGKQSSLMENLLLHSGDTITTGLQSFIALSLDDTKALGLGESSSADFVQSGKKIQVDIREGEAYFYTTEKLKDDETFDIRTETLIVGIRGTSGHFKIDESDGTTTFMLTSGKVHVTGINPNTGGTREADVEAGQVINVYLFNDKVGEDSVVFNIDGFDVPDIPDILLSEIVSNDDLLEEVAEDLGVPEEDLINAYDDDNDDESGAGGMTGGSDPDIPSTEPTVPIISGEDPDNPSDDPEYVDPSEDDPEEDDPEEGDPEEGDPEEGDPEEGDPEEGDPEEGDPEEGDHEEGDPEEGDPEEGDPEEGDPEEGDPEEGDPDEPGPGDGPDSPTEPTSTVTDPTEPATDPTEPATQPTEPEG